MNAQAKPAKPLGRKAYGSIGHLPCSRIGPGDHHVNAGQGTICTKKTRDKNDRVIIQEKLDGSCVAVALLDGRIIPLIRSGYEAKSSHREQHRLFDEWVWMNESRFRDLLEEGERVCGEWLAQAHGIKYRIDGVLSEPFKAFDIMKEDKRLDWPTFVERICSTNAPLSTTRFCRYGPCRPQDVFANDPILNQTYYGREGPAEGLVYRVERFNGTSWEVDFLAKWVRPDFVPGKFLPEISGQEEVWNWR